MKILLSVGHNSSAILVENNKILIGFEEERLSKVKSDSAFPKLSLEKIIQKYPKSVKKVNEIFISHWFNTFKVNFNNKYIDMLYLNSRFYNAKIKSVNKNKTHHDLHANSIWNMTNKKGLTIISDGFGNMEEVFSVYKNGILIHRCYDLYSSFGLMYQYATSFVGGKENEDEYKFISYETRMNKNMIERIMPFIDSKVKELKENILVKNKMSNKLVYFNSTVVDIKKLMNVKKTWTFYFNNILKTLKINKKDSRQIIGFLVQSILEKTMIELINHFGHDENGVKLSGGVFNNAKLNNAITRNVQKIDIHPLCGDQGAGLGFLNIKFNDLFWGERDFEIYKEVNGFCEIVKDNLEFGPRSLLNTSVISNDCTIKMSQKINKYYGRNNLMPTAFACTTEKFNDLFPDSHKIGISKQYMVTSLDIRDNIESNNLDKIKGVLLYDPFRDKWTGRCQVIDNNEIVNKYGIVINTSLNAHGQPLIYNKHDYNRMQEIINEKKYI